MLKIRIKSAELLLFMLMFMLAGGVFLYLVGKDALQGKNAFQFFADSNTYLDIFEAAKLGVQAPLVGVSDNYIGPLFVLELLNGNIYLVLLLNICIFFLSITWATSSLDISPLKVGALLLLSPMTTSTLLSVNKEVFIFPFIALVIAGYVRRSFVYFLLALFVSIFVRWQLTAFYLVMLSLSVPLRLLGHRRLILGVLLVAISAVYVLLAEAFAPVLNVVERSILDDPNAGSGLFTMLLNYQSRGLYFLVFPIKALHLLFALGLRFDRLMRPGNIYNDVFVVLHCTATLLVFALLVRRRLLTLRSDLIYGSAIFLIVFCLSPIYAPRYLFPVYVSWVFVLAGAPMHCPVKRRSWFRRTSSSANALLMKPSLVSSEHAS